MNKETIQEIKKDLISKKTELEKELSNFTTKNSKDEYTSTFPEYGDESDENAQEVSQHTTNLEAERILEKTLKDINNTLKQIEDGKYGVCKYCKNEIEEKRLKIRPFSSACVSCKTKLQSRN